MEPRSTGNPRLGRGQLACPTLPPTLSWQLSLMLFPSYTWLISFKKKEKKSARAGFAATRGNLFHTACTRSEKFHLNSFSAQASPTNPCACGWDIGLRGVCLSCEEENPLLSLLRRAYTKLHSAFKTQCTQHKTGVHLSVKTATTGKRACFRRRANAPW